MALLALHGVHFRSHAKPGKGDIGAFDGQIHLDTSVLWPYGFVSGRFIVHTNNDILSYGIRVQLDATVSLKFETKVDNRVSTHKKIEGILQDASDPGDGYYILSPIRELLAGTLNDDDRATGLAPQDIRDHAFTLEPGTHTYPFTLMMPGESLPAPFRSQYGNLHYKIVAYMRSSFCWVQVAEKPLRFRGYNNLTQVPNYLEPIKHESGFQKSMFSSKKAISAIMTLERRGFLPGEEMSFSLNIINPKWFVVRKVSVNLVRRVIYNVNGATKTTLVNLDSYESNDVSKDEEIFMTGKLTVPKNCIPTYNIKAVYSIMHLLQYQVKVAEYPGPMKGQIEINIGTTKEPIETLMTRRMATLQVEDPGTPPGPRSRSSSISSRLSDSSCLTVVSLPPSYSQLSSRAMSMISLETLPPHYDDLSNTN